MNQRGVKQLTHNSITPSCMTCVSYGSKLDVLCPCRKCVKYSHFVEKPFDLAEALEEDFKIIKTDNVENPNHYTYGKIECIDVIEDWKLGFHLGCALKYICRADHKGKPREDLRKAIWYLKRAMLNLPVDKPNRIIIWDEKV